MSTEFSQNISFNLLFNTLSDNTLSINYEDIFYFFYNFKIYNENFKIIDLYEIMRKTKNQEVFDFYQILPLF